MSEKKKGSSLSLSAKAKKFGVSLSTLKTVFRRGVAAWNSGHRPGTTPQQWGHARVNSYLRKGKTYHTADKDLHEETEQLNELKTQTYTNYIDATYGDSPAAEARKLGNAKHAKRIVGRIRARKLRAQQLNSPENVAARAAEYLRNNPPVIGSRFDEEAKVLGTNCKNCKWWKEDTEQKVDKSELNENGGLKSPNEQYLKMSKHVDMVSLPGKATVSVKAFCDHDDVKNFVTERMCCAYWDGEGTKREFKGEADVLSEESYDINTLFEMQLVGTDEYRQHAIAMTPGQEQEIEDAFPPEVYGTQVQEPQQQEESANAESDGSVESGDNYSTGNGFRTIRKKLKEQEEVEAEEEDEEETEDDGAEDGVDFTPNLKTTKIKNAGPKEYAGNATNGFPVLGIAEENKVVPVNFKGYQQLKQHPSFDPKKKVGLDPTGQVWQKVNWNKPAPKTPEKKVIQTPFLQPPKQEYKQVYSLTKSEPQPKAAAPKPELKVVRPTAASSKLKDLLGKAGKGTAKVGAGLTVLGAAEKVKAGDYAGAATDIGAELGGRVLAKTAGKALLKKLPLIGAGMGAAAAYERAKSGDITGAAGEALSGLASTLPGAGTAASTAIDAALMARDITKKQKKKPTLSEAVEYHNENNISLVENIFRPGSDMFFAMILEAKRQYAEGTYTPKDEFEQDLLESDIGEVAEYEGETVLLDFPYEEEVNEETESLQEISSKPPSAAKKFKYFLKTPRQIPAPPGGHPVPPGYERVWDVIRGGYVLRKLSENATIEEESDPTKGKGIGKPFRSGGGGAVYVRNAKGNIVKVNFSQSGMKKRYNEPARVKSFVARHHCYSNKDRTSASYWACRWPRYFSDSGQQWW